jgi:hypothetical protein
MRRLLVLLAAALAGGASCAHGECAAKADNCPSKLVICGSDGACACAGSPAEPDDAESAP